MGVASAAVIAAILLSSLIALAIVDQTRYQVPGQWVDVTKLEARPQFLQWLENAKDESWDFSDMREIKGFDTVSVAHGHKYVQLQVNYDESDKITAISIVGINRRFGPFSRTLLSDTPQAPE